MPDSRPWWHPFLSPGGSDLPSDVLAGLSGPPEAAQAPPMGPPMAQGPQVPIFGAGDENALISPLLSYLAALASEAPQRRRTRGIQPADLLAAQWLSRNGSP